MLVDHTGKDFVLSFAKNEVGMTAEEAMRERGMDFSRPDSTPQQSVFYCKDPWPVADLIAHASPRAADVLKPISDRIALSRAPDSGRHFKMPADCELWGFQRASLDYVLSRNQSLIADQPGLGKTPMAIVYANEISAEKVLVICPAAIRHQWARRIRQWSTMQQPYLTYVVTNSKNGIHPHAEWTVISYSLARNPALVAAFAKMFFDLVIVDESHFCKESDTSQTRAIFGQADGKYHWKRGEEPLPSIVSCAAHVLCLSGTPIVNRPLEAYTTSRALCWDAIDYLSLDRFRQRYNPQRTVILSNNKRLTDEKIGRVRELGNRMRGMFMARHAKRDVMTQLKMPRYEVVTLEETTEVKKVLRAESLLGLDIDALQTTNDYDTLGHIATVRREMGIALAPQVADYIAMQIEGGQEKIVLFAWHIEVLDILHQKLARFGVLRVDGSTSAKKRQEYVDTFIRDRHMKIFLGNIQSIGTGTDGLQEVASYCCLAEPDWTPGNNQQAVDRLDRGGQKGHVQADFIVAPGSLAEKILVRALEKAHTISKVIG